MIPHDTPDDGPTIPTRFRVYPEPGPEAVALGKLGLALAFVLGAICGALAGWWI